MSDDLKICTACGQFMPIEERDYWVFWAYFNGLEMDSDVQCCLDCITEQLSESDSDFVVGTMRPETFMVLKRARQMGMNLESKLSEIDRGGFVQELSLTKIDEIVQWLNSDIDIDEAAEWTHLFQTFEEAMRWRSAGFHSQMDQEWRKWGDDPQEIIQLAANSSFGVGAIYSEFVPEIGFQDLGFSLTEAIEYRNYLFTSTNDRFENGTSPVYRIQNYLPTQLNLDELLSLRDVIEFDPDLSWYVYDDDFWALLRTAVTHLKEQQMEISGENLGTQIEILKTEG